MNIYSKETNAQMICSSECLWVSNQWADTLIVDSGITMPIADTVYDRFLAPPYPPWLWG